MPFSTVSPLVSRPFPRCQPAVDPNGVAASAPLLKKPHDPSTKWGLVVKGTEDRGRGVFAGVAIPARELVVLFQVRRVGHVGLSGAAWPRAWARGGRIAGYRARARRSIQRRS